MLGVAGPATTAIQHQDIPAKASQVLGTLQTAGSCTYYYAIIKYIRYCHISLPLFIVGISVNFLCDLSRDYYSLQTSVFQLFLIQAGLVGKSLVRFLAELLAPSVKIVL